MIKERLFLAAALTVASTFATWAQTVQGTITDAATGESIIGATVKYGDGKGVTTDIDGHFALDVKSLPVKLNISFTGYRPQTVTVYDDEEDINVKLAEKRSYLNDVVVVGYGTQSRTQLTGSVVTVKADVFENSIASTLDGALSGQVAGLNVTAASGQPGADSSIRIRGGNSVNASNEPLYVVDGFIYYKDASSNGTGLGAIESSLNPLATINPNDIESIEVLKDVSATAIYGSRGANGVILITTKKGKLGEKKAHISYGYSLGLSSVSKHLDLLNASEWAQFQKTYFSNKGGYTDEQIKALGKGTDWQDAVLRTGCQALNGSVSCSVEDLSSLSPSPVHSPVSLIQSCELTAQLALRTWAGSAPPLLLLGVGVRSPLCPQLRTLSCLCLGVCTWLLLGARPLPEEEILRNPSGGELRNPVRGREEEKALGS